MKNTIKFSKIIFIFLLIPLLFSINTIAWDDCPFGYEDEPFPGSCWRYVDKNNDGICDHSQSNPSLFQDESSAESNTQTQNQNLNQTFENKYLLLVIISFLIIFSLAIATRYLKKIKKLSNLNEKIIWNLLLLIFFLPSGITGIILVLMPSIPFLREIGLNFIQLHNITSFFFMWISAYHIIWHTGYYTKGIKKLLK
jgi:hypothetical protein